MRIAETVTFGGSGLDRAAALRGDPKAMAYHLAVGTVLPVWRGKPLLSGAETCRAGWVPLGHPVLAHGGTTLFLGLDGGIARFAQDMSSWSPEAGADAVQAGFFDASEQRHPSLPQDHVFAELRGAMTRLTPRDAELAATAKALLQWHASHGFCATCGATPARASCVPSVVRNACEPLFAVDLQNVDGALLRLGPPGTRRCRRDRRCCRRC
jgi:NAD+ diphosphatase